MAICSVCKKKGLFLTINQYGQCSSCELAELNRTRAYFKKLCSLYSDISSTESGDFDSKLKTCSLLSNEIQSHVSFPRLNDILRSKLVYETSADKSRGLGKIPVFNFSFHRNLPDIVEMFFNLLDNRILYYTLWYQNKKQTSQFEETMDLLPRTDIKISTEIKKTHSLSDIDILHSNITTRSNLDKLGTFVSIDIETTGLRYTSDKIIEVAAVMFRDWIPESCFVTYVNPSCSIPDFITNLTGITDATVSNAPTFSSICGSLLEYIGDYPLVGHNLIDFDLNFLYRNGLDFATRERKYYDTLPLARKVFKKSDDGFGIENYKLDTLCSELSIRDNSSSHNALSDSLAAGLLFKELSYRICNS